MQHDDVIEDSVRLVQVAVQVTLVLDVVVGPREVGARGCERGDRIDSHLPRAEQVVRVADITGLASQLSAEYHASECGRVSQGETSPPST